MACKFYLAIALLATSASAAPESRIVGGTPISISEFPYVVALLYRYPGSDITVQRCVGSLISSYHILTSAFCFEGANIKNMLIRAGSNHSLSGGVVSTIREVKIHYDFVPEPIESDIAVVILDTPIGLSNTIGVLYLPPQNWDIVDGQSLKVVSWGFKSKEGPQNEFLKTVTLNKLNIRDCQAIYFGIYGHPEVVVGLSTICASQPGPIGLCLGDSGAPMAIDNVVVGIGSYFPECGDDAYPDVFTRVDRFSNWILEVATMPNSARMTDAADNIMMAPKIAV